jgi:hypothetical protein
VGEHLLVAAQLAGVRVRPAEDLAPPGGDVCPVILADAAGEVRRQQVVGLDAVVEGVDQAPEGGLAARPLIQRRGLRG